MPELVKEFKRPNYLVNEGSARLQPSIILVVMFKQYKPCYPKGLTCAAESLIYQYFPEMFN